MNFRPGVFPVSFVLLLYNGVADQALSASYQSSSTASSSFAQVLSETPQPQMSKKAIKTLIANAKTAEDHHKIATYFAQRSLLFEERSHEYQARCVLVAEHPTNYKTKYPSAYDDCQFWEQYYASQSSKAENTAKFHEQLAIRLAGEKR